ncbi:MAG TPA: response regulator transcription factor [Opitutaceae bacterium]|nr:response regulator transcription factor [Opitutaceae bacterium]
MNETPLHSPAMKRASVVVIEDHTLVRDLLTAVLEEDPALELAGNFANVADGIKGCLRLRPKLAIVDWMLPDGKGIDVVRGLAPKLPGTRFLFLSSIEKEHVVREAIDAGVDGFVMKRASYDTLLEAIRVILGGKSYYCPVSSRLLVEALRTAANAGANVLSARERDILVGIARGETVKSIAHRAGLSPKTVNNQLAALRDKLGIRDTVGLVRYALHHGIVEEL